MNAPFGGGAASGVTAMRQKRNYARTAAFVNLTFISRAILAVSAEMNPQIARIFADSPERKSMRQIVLFGLPPIICVHPQNLRINFNPGASEVRQYGTPPRSGIPTGIP